MSKLHRQIAKTYNTNILKRTVLPTPAQLKADLPITNACWKTVLQGRKTISEIIHGRDSRLLVAMGPCSVHNPKETLAYAKWFKTLQEKLRAAGNRLFLVMRVVFVKPRTKKDWTGFFNDPDMNGKCNIEKGRRLGRELLLEITEMGIPVATEYLDVNSLQTVDDLYSFYWIGARSIEFQGYRDEASALSTPVGFKNSTHGSLDTALSSMHWATQRNVLTAPDDNGLSTRFATKGNPNGILILRGTNQGPNYDTTNVGRAHQLLRSSQLNSRVIIDVNHGNSQKDHLKQAEIIAGLGDRIGKESGAQHIAGIVYESSNCDGKQLLTIKYGERPRLRPGVSVTDGCDGIERSEKVILDFNERVQRTSPASPTGENSCYPTT